MDVLIVGGTRILRPAVIRLVAEGAAVGVVARGVEELLVLEGETSNEVGRVVRLAVDYLAVSDLLHAVDAAGGYREAILYLPLAPSATVEALVGRAARRAVVIRTTSWAAPGSPPVEIGARTRAGQPAAVLQLGWATTAAGRAAWHDPAAISAAALELLRSDAGSRTLGLVRPWSARPG